MMEELIELIHNGIIKETKKAVLFEFEEEVWIPRSVIEEYDNGYVTLEQWFAVKEELEVYES